MAQRIDEEEQEYILGLYEQSIKNGHGLLATYGYIARATGHHERTIQGVMRKLLPTTKLATAKLRAASSKLVDRLIAKAEVPDILDILSRPNIGVLAPASKGGSDGPTGIFVSVNAESCGAVKLGVVTGQALPPSPTQEAADVQEGHQGYGHESNGRGEGLRPLVSGALEGVVDSGEAHHEEDRPRRPERGRRQRAKVKGLQESDEQSEGAGAEAQEVLVLRKSLGL